MQGQCGHQTERGMWGLMRTAKMIALCIIAVLFAGICFADTIVKSGTINFMLFNQHAVYVSESGSGLKDGSSQDNAWAGFSAIQWGTNPGQAGPYSNLYICGEIRQSLVVGISGTSRFPVVIRGDCPGDPGIINGSKVESGPWTLVANNIYTMPISNFYGYTSAGMVMEDDAPLVKVNWDTNASTTMPKLLSNAALYSTGTWSHDVANGLIYILMTGADDPTGHTIEASYGSIYSTQIVATNKTYITIKNLTVKDAADYGIDFNSGAIANHDWVISGGYHVVNNCHIYNIGNWAVFMGGQTNATVSNNSFDHDVWLGHLPQQQATGEVVRMDGVGGWVFNNTVTYSPAIALNLYHVSGVYEYNNIIHDNWSKSGSTFIPTTSQYTGGLYFDRALNCHVFNNMVYNWIDGINVNDEDGRFPSSGNYIYNNVVFNSYQQGMFIGGGSNWIASQDNYILNNIIYQGPQSPNTVALMLLESMNDTFKNNIIWGTIQIQTSANLGFTAGQFDYNTYYGLMSWINNGYAFVNWTDWKTMVSGDTHSTQRVQSNPSAQFIHPTSSPWDFSLTSSSYSRNAGTNLSSLFTTDYRGTTRPSSGAWDDGAYQYA